MEKRPEHTKTRPRVRSMDEKGERLGRELFLFIVISYAIVAVFLPAVFGFFFVFGDDGEDGEFSASFLDRRAFLPVVINSHVGMTNPDFESSLLHKKTAWVVWGESTVRNEEFVEVNPAYGWTAFWVVGYPSWQKHPNSEGVVGTGNPEVIRIDLGEGFPDESRVFSGSAAQKWFSFYMPHYGGIAQRVELGDGRSVTVYVRSFATHGLKHADLYIDLASLSLSLHGETATFSVYVHSWYTSCSSRTSSDPLEPDCHTPIGWAHQFLSLGIDPSGGEINPLSEAILWGPEFEQYGTYSRTPHLLTVEVSK